MSGELAGKVGIVTSAATGIGKAIAIAMAAVGGRVVVNHLNTSDRAEAVVAQITGGGGGEAIAVAADVSKRTEYTALVDAAFERFGSWDIDATNGAIEAMSHVISKEFGPRGITVNVVSSGATETETYRDGKSEQFLAGLETMSAFGRLGRPEEIAAAVAILASDHGHWVTAQNVRVNGGTV